MRSSAITAASSVYSCFSPRRPRRPRRLPCDIPHDEYLVQPAVGVHPTNFNIQELIVNRNSNLCVTIATQRSGTKALGACFNAGTTLLTLGEIFHDDNKTITGFARFAESSGDFARKYVTGQVDSILDDYFLALSKMYVGIHFDCMYGNMDFLGQLWTESTLRPSIFNYFISREFAVIHLKRDPRDSFVSLKDAQRSSVYHFSATGESIDLASGPPLVNDNLAEVVAGYEAYKRGIIRQRLKVDQAFKGYAYYTSINYEELIGDDGFMQPISRRKIAKILGNDAEADRIQVYPINLGRSVRSAWAIKLGELIK
jgi:hypothetical protein